MTDELARDIIVKQLDKNIFVVAGAGSGKTSMLVNRIVALIEAGEDVSSICAITFTVNAAAEFRDRLTSVLLRRSQGIEAKEDLRSGGLGKIYYPDRDKIALENIDLCFTGTIDAFSNLILSEYPLDAGIPSSSSVIDEKEEISRYKKEYASIAHNEPDNPAFINFTRIFKNPSETFASAIKDVVSMMGLEVVYHEPSKNVDEYVKYYKDKYETALKGDIAAIVNHASLLKDTKTNKEAFKALNNYKDVLSSNWGIEEIIKIPKLKKDILEKFVFKDDPNINDCLYYDKLEGKKDYTYISGCTLDAFIDEINLMKHTYAVDFLLYAGQKVRATLKKEGKLTFTEYLYTFRNMVMEDLANPDMPLINHIRKRYKHFLIDESQDTSPFQYDIFLCLSSIKSEKDIKDITLIPGSLFIVGDPKQSIYRFRGADISSYKNVEKRFSNEDNIVVELYNNFRSSKALCGYFNDVFASMEDYEPIGNVETKNEYDGSGLYQYSSIVDVIKNMVHNPSYSIIDRNGYRKSLEYSDFMILANGKDHLPDIGEQLSINKIPYYIEGKNDLSVSPLVESVYAIYAYLVDPLSLESEYNLYASPLFNYCINEIVTFDKAKLSNRDIEIINQISKLSDITNPVILFEKIYEEFPLFKYVSSNGLDYIYYIKNKLEEAYVNKAVTSKKDSLRYIEELIKEPLERSSQLSDKVNAVYIANTHKVKGLEAPVVILDKAGNAAITPTQSLDYISNKAYLFRIGKNKYKGASFYDVDASSIYKDEESYEKEQLGLEKARLRYVAVTRARNYLLINNSSRNSAWDDLIKEGHFVDFSVSESLIERFDNDVSIINSENIYPINNINISYNTSPTYHIVLPSKLRLNYEKEISDEYVEETSGDAAVKGTLVHALLEGYISSNMKADINTLIDSILTKYHIDDIEYRNMLLNVMDDMNSGGYMQADGKPVDLFMILSKASDISVEVPFAYKHGDNIYNGVIDLLYKYNDKYYIVDYKTNLDGDDLDNKYANQLKAYRYAVKNVLGIDAEASIYHIEIH